MKTATPLKDKNKRSASLDLWVMYISCHLSREQLEFLTLLLILDRGLMLWLIKHDFNSITEDKLELLTSNIEFLVKPIGNLIGLLTKVIIKNVNDQIPKNCYLDYKWTRWSRKGTRDISSCQICCPSIRNNFTDDNFFTSSRVLWLQYCSSWWESAWKSYSDHQKRITESLATKVQDRSHTS